MSTAWMSDSIANAISRTKVSVREVGLREGIQSTDHILDTADKVALFRGLVAAGCREINPLSFVNRGRMPQMADAEQFLAELGDDRDGITLWGLVLNDAGLDRALAARAEGLLDGMLTVFSLNSAGMAANGITADPARLLAEIARRAERAAAQGLRVAVFISGVFGDQASGAPDLPRIVAAAAEIHSLPGVSELIISDSTGHADPLQLLGFLDDLSRVLPTGERLGLHLHDTRGAGLANVFAALTSPFDNLVFDAAFGGWGGDYPMVAESFGNIATEDLVEMLYGSGIDTGIDVDAVVSVTRRYARQSHRRYGAKLPDASTVSWKRPARAIAS